MVTSPTGGPFQHLPDDCLTAQSEPYCCSQVRVTSGLSFPAGMATGKVVPIAIFEPRVSPPPSTTFFGRLRQEQLDVVGYSKPRMISICSYYAL